MIEAVDGVPVLAVSAESGSGSGKTTLLRALVGLLSAQGLRVGCIKHSHHVIDIDHPGKDSHALRAAGTRQMLIHAARSWALIVDQDEVVSDDMVTLVRRLDLRVLDLVLLEGYKREDIAQLVLHRHDLSGPFACTPTPTMIAIASNQSPLPQSALPVFALDDAAAIAEFIRARCERLKSLRDGGARA